MKEFGVRYMVPVDVVDYTDFSFEGKELLFEFILGIR